MKDTTLRPCTAEVFDGHHAGTFAAQPCGCEIIGEGNLRSPMTIKRCALHEAADDLAGACESMLETTGGSKHWNGATHESLLLIEAALLKANR